MLARGPLWRVRRTLCGGDSGSCDLPHGESGAGRNQEEYCWLAAGEPGEVFEHALRAARREASPKYPPSGPASPGRPSPSALISPANVRSADAARSLCSGRGRGASPESAGSWLNWSLASPATALHLIRCLGTHLASGVCCAAGR